MVEKIFLSGEEQVFIDLISSLDKWGENEPNHAY